MKEFSIILAATNSNMLMHIIHIFFFFFFFFFENLIAEISWMCVMYAIMVPIKINVDMVASLPLVAGIKVEANFQGNSFPKKKVMLEFYVLKVSVFLYL